MIDHLLELLFPLFFPECCKGCGKTGGALCTKCKGRLPPAEPISDPDHCIALYHYGNKIVRQAVWDLKYYRKSTLAKELIFNDGNILQSYIEKWLTETSTKRVALVPIPQHYTKTFSRGFNQSLVVAKWIRVHIPQGTIAQILVKIKATTAQAHIENKVRRQKNLHQSMKAVKILDSSILYIVVDDVITTGSTITEAGRALRAAGAKHVYAIALAHGFTNARPASRA